MITAAHRFHGRNALNDVYRRGKMVRGPLFAVRALPNPRRESYRASVVVSRKVHKSAVRRNRIRRRLYALIRETMANSTQACDIVITVFHADLLNEPHNALSQQLKQQLISAGCLNDRPNK